MLFEIPAAPDRASQAMNVTGPAIHMRPAADHQAAPNAPALLHFALSIADSDPLGSLADRLRPATSSPARTVGPFSPLRSTLSPLGPDFPPCHTVASTPTHSSTTRTPPESLYRPLHANSPLLHRSEEHTSELQSPYVISYA